MAGCRSLTFLLLIGRGIWMSLALRNRSYIPGPDAKFDQFVTKFYAALYDGAQSAIPGLAAYKTALGDGASPTSGVVFDWRTQWALIPEQGNADSDTVRDKNAARYLLEQAIRPIVRGIQASVYSDYKAYKDGTFFNRDTGWLFNLGVTTPANINAARNSGRHVLNPPKKGPAIELEPYGPGQLEFHYWNLASGGIGPKGRPNAKAKPDGVVAVQVSLTVLGVTQSFFPTMSPKVYEFPPSLHGKDCFAVARYVGTNGKFSAWSNRVAQTIPRSSSDASAVDILGGGDPNQLMAQEN